MDIYNSGFNKLIASGKTIKQANAIMQAQFEKSGLFMKGTKILTAKGIAREGMTEEERAIDRVSKGINSYKYKYVNGRVIKRNIFK